MAALLGKRKRRTDLIKNLAVAAEVVPNDRLNKLLQQHFEASYAPLEIEPVAVPVREDSPTYDQDDEEWDGISEDEGANMVEVVTEDAYQADDRWRAKQERRSFMSNKPPSLIKAPQAQRPESVAAPADDAEDAANLKNDLRLQRLLQESSLLQSARTDAHGTMPSAVHPSDTGTDALALRGADRHKALDLRLQKLGAKDSVYQQKKMPLSHRLGIVEKKRTREKDRRKEAKENGIVLEKETKRKGSVRRERGIGGPSVGRMKGGTLVLSRRDVREIEGVGRGGSHQKRPQKRP